LELGIRTNTYETGMFVISDPEIIFCASLIRDSIK